MRKLKIIKRSIVSYLKYKMGKSSPFIAVFNVTHRCNLKCPYCAIIDDCIEYEKLNNVLESCSDEVTTEQAKVIIEKVAELGVAYITFSGGEPLLRKDIFELGNFAKSKGLSTSLYTNGILIEKEMIPSLEKGFDTIMVSFPEMKAKKLRTEKEIDKTKKSLSLLKASSINTGISFVITKDNFHQMESVCEYAKNSVDFLYLNPVHYAPAFTPQNRVAGEIQKRAMEVKKNNFNLVENSVEFIDKFEDFFLGKPVAEKCDAFNLYLSILPNGALQGCCEPFLAGNIIDDGLKKSLEKALKNKNKLTDQCDKKKMMGGCGQVSYLFNEPIHGSFFSAFKLIKKTLLKR